MGLKKRMTALLTSTADLLFGQGQGYGHVSTDDNSVRVAMGSVNSRAQVCAYVARTKLFNHGPGNGVTVAASAQLAPYDDHDLHVRAHVLLAHVSLGVSLPSKVVDKLSDAFGRRGRVFSLEWHHNTLWWNIGTVPDEWNATNGWQHGNWSPVDALLGRPLRDIYYDSDEKEVQIHVSPDETYVGRYQRYVVVERRRRWLPNGHIVAHCASVDVTGGVPHPGKGTDAHNIGDDATYSAAFGHRDRFPEPEEVVAHLAERVNYCRKNYPL